MKMGRKIGMQIKARSFIGLFFLAHTMSALHAAPCTGHVVNPVKDVCWRCLFPLSIGKSQVVGGRLPDTPNAKKPIGVCASRVGLNLGYWEPMALAEVTDTPYCLVNLGGHRLPLGIHRAQGGRQGVGFGEPRAFFEVHWYRYPLIQWLNLITSQGCKQAGDFDIAYLTELDPSWHDSEMSLILNPEAHVFGGVAGAQACAADSISSSVKKKPLDNLFWCAGAQGSYYPLTGYVNAALSPVQIALLLTERLNFKLHREHMIADSNPEAPCHEHHISNTPKSRYRYEMVNQVPDGQHCYPSGHTTLGWEAGKIKPNTPSQYGFLVWRKRNCVFL
jgi:conjugal transfer pilus assembly protein TraU